MSVDSPFTESPAESTEASPFFWERSHERKLLCLLAAGYLVSAFICRRKGVRVMSDGAMNLLSYIIRPLMMLMVAERVMNRTDRLGPPTPGFIACVGFALRLSEGFVESVLSLPVLSPVLNPVMLLALTGKEPTQLLSDAQVPGGMPLSILGWACTWGAAFAMEQWVVTLIPPETADVRDGPRMAAEVPQKAAAPKQAEGGKAGGAKNAGNGSAKKRK